MNERDDEMRSTDRGQSVVTVETGDASAARGHEVLAVSILLTAGLLFYLAPSLPWLFLAFAVVLTLAMWKPIASLALVSASAPLFQQPKHLLGHYQPAPQEVFLAVSVLALGVAVLQGRLQPRWRALRRSPFLVPAMLFVATGCVSSVLASQLHLALRALYQLVLEPLLYFALLSLFVRRASEWWWILLAVLLVTVVDCGIAIGQYLSGVGVSMVPNSSLQRARGLYRSPDNLGLWLDRVLPFLTAILLWMKLRLSVSAALLIACLLMLVALGYTFSRGAWIGIGATLVLLCLFRPGWTRYVGITLLAVGSIVTAADFRGVARVLETGHHGTTSARLDIWQSSIQMIRDHPIFGIGPDNFTEFYAPRPSQQKYSPCRGHGYIIEPSASNEPCSISHPHNEVLDFWLSVGIVGLMAACWLQIVFWRTVVRAWRNRTPATAALVAGAAAAMGAALIHGFVDNFYFLMDLSLSFWLLAALVQFCAESTTEKIPEPLP